MWNTRTMKPFFYLPDDMKRKMSVQICHPRNNTFRIIDLAVRTVGWLTTGTGITRRLLILRGTIVYRTKYCS